MVCSLPGSSVHGILQARILEWVALSYSRGVFLTQGSSPGLLHCRQILYHLSHQGSPCSFLLYSKMSQPYLYVYPVPFGFPFCSGHQTALSRVPCTIQYFSLVIYFIHSINSVYVANSVSSSSCSLPPLVSIRLFSTSVSLFQLCT